MKNTPIAQRRRIWPVKGLALSLCLCAGTLTGCGKGAPSVDDLQPPLMSDLGQCDLWTISDIKKIDGIPGKESYRVDFSATLTMKNTPRETLQKLHENEYDPRFMSCHIFIAHLARPDLSLWKQYGVTGAGEFVKSEKGWRLLGELGQYEFMPTHGQAESQRAVLRPVDSNPAPPEQVPPVAQAATEPAPSELALSPCVAAKMTEYDKQRSKEIDELGREARARGEEVQISAGPEEFMRQEALGKATADCR